MYCKNCGNPFEGKFCPNCGAPAEQSPNASPPSPTLEQGEREGKPITKRWWFWVLAALTIVVIILSLTNKADQSKTDTEAVLPEVKEASVTEEAATTEEPASLLDIGSKIIESAMEEVEPTSGDVTVSEQVVLDQDGVRVTVLSMDMENWFGPTLNVLIENNTDKSLTVQARESSVNGVMMDPYFSCDVAAGKKANGEISYLSTDLSDAGITTIQTMELLFYVYETDTWDEVFSSDIVAITTSAQGTFTQTYDTAGTEVLNEKGIRFVVQRLDEDDAVWGSNVRVYVENNSTRAITVQLTDVSVNGFMVDPYYYSALSPSKVSFDRVSFLQSDLDDNQISSIESLEFRIHVYDSNSWDTILDSDVITITF
ncbi:MAG: zinc ribbon domain-containing protein [Clostridiaceae bacterium]